VEPTTVYTLTNLDLIAYKELTNEVITSSLSLIDNVEQVKFNADYSSAVIKVDSASASIYGAEVERYALATEEGFSPRNGPTLVLYPVPSGDIQGPIGTIITMTVSVANQGDLLAHQVQLSVEASAGINKLSGPDLPVDIGKLSLGGISSQYIWTFQKTSDDQQYIRLIASSNSYGEIFTSIWEYRYSYFFPMIYK